MKPFLSRWEAKILPSLPNLIFKIKSDRGSSEETNPSFPFHQSNFLHRYTSQAYMKNEERRSALNSFSYQPGPNILSLQMHKDPEDASLKEEKNLCFRVN